MKKIFVLMIFTVVFLFNANLVFASSLEEDMNNAVFSSLGDAVAQVIEEKAGVPASSAGTITGYFAAGDFKDGFLEIVKLATDTAISAIPVLGPVKFAVSLESSLIGTWKTWFDWTEISSVWDKFKNLSDSEKQSWLNGGTIEEIDYSGAEAYLERNGYNLRTLFKKYYDAEQNGKTYLDYVKKISELLNDAKYLVEPSLYSSLSSSSKIKLNTPIEIWRSGNNYFKITVTSSDGQSESIIKKFSDSESTFTFSLSDFTNIDWSEALSENPGGVNVSFKIDAAIWDYTGLIEKLMGSDYVTPNEKILRNVPGQDKSSASLTFSTILTNDSATQKFDINLSGNLTFDYYSVSTCGTKSSTFQDSLPLDGLILHVTCKTDGTSSAVDSDGENWDVTCKYSTDNNGNVTFTNITSSISYTTLAVYFHITLNDDTCSASISSIGYYQTEYTFASTFSHSESNTVNSSCDPETAGYAAIFNNFGGSFSCSM